MTAPLEMVMVGAGHRARDAYGPFAEQQPDQARIVAVAEPNPLRRRQMAERFAIADEMCFESWQDLMARPQLAPLRRTDGCPVEAECAFFAPRLYAGPDGTWPRSVVSEIDSVKARMDALRTGPYGRCVYHCDNDVVDQQPVLMELESGVSVSLNFVGHSQREGRTLRIDGSRATLRGKFSDGDQQMEISDHLINRSELIPIDYTPDGHGGGDVVLIAAFIAALRSGQAETLTSARHSMESHLMAFAAEVARVNRTVIAMADYRRQVDQWSANAPVDTACFR